jgi:hypothetical protein
MLYTGLVSFEDILYVAEQKLGAILAFNIRTEKYLGKIVSGARHMAQIEQITLSPC